MITARVPLVDEPRRFEPHELFFSFTDSKGIIRYGNEVFTRVSGYAESELVGQPHNIIRHPHMPRCVFKLLWDYLEAGKTIVAYVKNLAADGRYYWVLASVMPCRDGYLSVRLNPSSPLFDAAKKLYAETLKLESAAEEDRGKKAAMEESLQFLSDSLQTAGFASYDDFMQAALKAELTVRAQFVRDSTAVAADTDIPGACRLVDLHDSLASVKTQLRTVFDSLDVFESLSERLLEKREAMRELGPSLTFLSLNTHISASQLGDEGAVLSVVSRNLGDRSKEADQLITALMERMAPACDAARAIAFGVQIAQLESEVCESFVKELLQVDEDGFHDLVGYSLDAITDELCARCESMLESLSSLASDIDQMTHAGRELVRRVDQMKTAQLNGKIDIAARRNADGFAAIFDDVARIVADARKDCDEILELLAMTEERLATIVKMERTLCNDLATVGDSTAEILRVNSAAVSA